jgi:hypothetical protein
MGTDHRGRRLGDNYRATPRLAQLIAKRQSNAAFKSTPDIAQGMLDEYRERRDFGDKGIISPMTGRDETAINLSNDQRFINQSLRTR